MQHFQHSHVQVDNKATSDNAINLTNTRTFKPIRDGNRKKTSETFSVLSSFSFLLAFVSNSQCERKTVETFFFHKNPLAINKFSLNSTSVFVGRGKVKFLLIALSVLFLSRIVNISSPESFVLIY